jgi:hypothetical protein
MVFERFRGSPRVRFELIVALGVVTAAAACGSGSDTTGQNNTGGPQSGSQAAGSGNSPSSGSSTSGSSPQTSGSNVPGSGSSQASGSSGGGSGTSSMEMNSPDAMTPTVVDGSLPLPDVSAPPSCVKGQVKPEQVVMIGDSYMAAAFGNVGANIVADAHMAGALPAGKNYREFYVAGSSMNGSMGSNLNIPYEYNTEAKGNVADNNGLTVTNPKDIQVVIMDGGGNDVLINQRSCLMDATEAALMADTACQTAVSNAAATMDTLWKQMASDGVKQIVYYFYPHLNTAGGGFLTTPAPGVNLVDDEGALSYQKICCGSTFTPTASAPTCTGNAPGIQCTYVDTRPAFEGKVAQYINGGLDNVHPNAMGSMVIANLVWAAMVQNCVAQ